jgi:hypothetical protein
MDRIGQGMIEYAQEFASYVGAKRLLIGMPGHGKYFGPGGFIDTTYEKIDFGQEKIGGYIVEKYYLDSAGKPKAYKVDVVNIAASRASSSGTPMKEKIKKQGTVSGPIAEPVPDIDAQLPLADAKGTDPALRQQAITKAIALAGGKAEEKGTLSQEQIIETIQQHNLYALVIDNKDNWNQWIGILTNNWGFNPDTVITAENPQQAKEKISNLPAQTKIILVINATNKEIAIQDLTAVKIGAVPDFSPSGNLNNLIYDHLSQSQALMDV